MEVARHVLNLLDDRAVEDLLIGILEDVTDHARDLGRGLFFRIDAVDENFSLRGLVEPVHHLGRRRFARAVLADDGHALAGADLEVQPLIGEEAVRIVKGHILKFNSLHGYPTFPVSSGSNPRR